MALLKNIPQRWSFRRKSRVPVARYLFNVKINRYLLNFYFFPSIVLDAGDIRVNETERGPVSMERTF